MMEAIQLDARKVASALHMGTDDLARLLTEWAGEAMPTLEYDRNWSPTSLQGFDESVARARRYLEDAHAAQAAWDADNPGEVEDPEA
jgi:hypothetical protein